MCIIYFSDIFIIIYLFPILQECLGKFIDDNKILTASALNIIIKIENLTVFECTNKYIKSLDRHLFSIGNSNRSFIKKLKILSLNNNQLTKLHPKQLNNLIELTHINLTKNYLKVIGPNIFKNNKKLKSIDISYNRIEKFNFDLSKLPYLHILNIDNNYLNSLNENSFRAYITRNKSVNTILSVKLNNLKCKCKMYWILKLGDKFTAYIFHDELCVSALNKHVNLTCFLNNNEEIRSTCSGINSTYCDKS